MGLCLFQTKLEPSSKKGKWEEWWVGRQLVTSTEKVQGREGGKGPTSGVGGNQGEPRACRFQGGPVTAQDPTLLSAGWDEGRALGA